MFDALWTLPLLPLAGFLVLALGAGRLSRTAAGWLGCGSVGLAALAALAIAARFLFSPPPGHAATLVLGRWFALGDGATARLALHYDGLALVMTLVVTVVGLLIHVYSLGYMRSDPGFTRFFAYLNLFVAAMLTLVLADDLVLLLLGWEGVGLCSYLLIGFWYRDPANGRAARKAFVVTRLGDTALLVGMFLLLTRLGSLRIADLLVRAPGTWAVGDPLAVAAAALILGGAVGKSAQLPLQTWLPDAMAGPTPVSALIHAATMVTAGVYLIARLHPLFLLAPHVLTATAVIGAATLLLAGGSALAQRDIKRVLAYSTISQLGYMFLALGVGAWSAAIFHLVTHAFFKALLFLAAGVVIHSLQDQHDLAAMGGLRRALPVTHAIFVVGGGALAGVPLVTAGFFSKDLILHDAFIAAAGFPWLWLAGLLGVALTAAYTARLILLVFHGPRRTTPTPHGDASQRWPLLLLTVLSVGGGWVWLPHNLGGWRPLAHVLAPVLGDPGHGAGIGLETTLQLASLAALAGGGAAAWLRWGPRRARTEVGPPSARLPRIAGSGWGFDHAQDRLVARPYLAAARRLSDDPVARVFAALARGVGGLHELLSATQTGNLRWYATVMALGLAMALGVALTLAEVVPR
jgi:NADH-quinone oxidoreductase subunit L